MSAIFPGRFTAQTDQPFVVFLIGMRVNHPWKVHKWWPVFRAMPRILAELAAHPEWGCLASENGLGVIVQYWRSFDHLEAYARHPDRAHWPAWKEFNRVVRASSGDVGIWHETFQVRAGQYECLYGSVPRRGLARAGRHLEVAEARDTARSRLGTS